MKGAYILFTLLFLMALANSAAADIASEALEIPYQVQNADRVISGTVVDIHQSNFHTIVTIQVDEWLMNPLPMKTITIRTEGGKNLYIEGQATFNADETVLLMLKDVDIRENRFNVLWGEPGKHPVSDRGEVLRAISLKERFDDQRNQTSEVLTGEIINVDYVPDKWNRDLSNFNYAALYVQELENQPDKFFTISNRERYPYLEQAISNIRQESWGRSGHVEFNSFDDTVLDDLLENKNITNIEMNNTYFKVNFLAQDPIAPISYQFDNYFELKVNNVEKSSTNITRDTIVKILYSDSVKYRHVKKGEMARVWIDIVDPGQLNETLNLTLYKTRNDMEGYDIEHLDSLGNNDAKTTGINDIPSIRAGGTLLVFFGAVLATRFRK
ncbi:MAG: hypothetical protein P1P80_06600 [ANME-2 cluster archaeon]|nr:hypothetical protein [ANME-2 cluster archaeon]